MTKCLSKNVKKNFTAKDKITILIQEGLGLARPISDLVPDDTRILCRKWAEAFNYVDNVSDDQKKQINDIYNVYAYRLNRSIKEEIELKRDAWIQSVLDIAELEESYQNRDIPSAIRVFEKYLDIKDIFNDFENEKLLQLQSVIYTWETVFQNDLSKFNIKCVVDILNDKFSILHNIKVLENIKYPQEGDEDYFEPIYEKIDKMSYGVAKKRLF